MVDHLAWAEGYRSRAAKCQFVAKEISSTSFERCYRLLAAHYMLLADLEEDFARRAAAMQQATSEALLPT
jgi:hypothetical protein